MFLHQYLTSNNNTWLVQPIASLTFQITVQRVVLRSLPGAFWVNSRFLHPKGGPSESSWKRAFKGLSCLLKERGSVRWVARNGKMSSVWPTFFYNDIPWYQSTKKKELRRELQLTLNSMWHTTSTWCNTSPSHPQLFLFNTSEWFECDLNPNELYNFAKQQRWSLFEALNDFKRKDLSSQQKHIFGHVRPSCLRLLSSVCNSRAGGMNICTSVIIPCFSPNTGMSGDRH